MPNASMAGNCQVNLQPFTESSLSNLTFYSYATPGASGIRIYECMEARESWICSAGADGPVKEPVSDSCKRHHTIVHTNVPVSSTALQRVQRFSISITRWCALVSVKGRINALG